MQGFVQALALFPPETAAVLRAAAASRNGKVNEIRLTLGGHAILVFGERNVVTDALCDEALLQTVLLALCGGSLYAHGDTIREGFVYSDAGLRAGVCGHAILENGKVRRVFPITSISIRIPARFPGVYDALLPEIVSGGVPRSALIWSPPGVGKTSALRELALALSSVPYRFRCALIDTRYELASGLSSDLLYVYSGYPRACGMETAIRTMAPQIVICDEIAGEEDASAVLECALSGAAVLASAHASSAEALAKRPALQKLWEARVFALWIGLERTAAGIRFHCTERG